MNHAFPGVGSKCPAISNLQSSNPDELYRRVRERQVAKDKTAKVAAQVAEARSSPVDKIIYTQLLCHVETSEYTCPQPSLQPSSLTPPGTSFILLFASESKGLM